LSHLGLPAGPARTASEKIGIYDYGDESTCCIWSPVAFSFSFLKAHQTCIRPKRRGGDSWSLYVPKQVNRHNSGFNWRNGCAFNHVVGNRVLDTPLQFQPITRPIGSRQALFVWSGCARLCMVTATNSTAGLRNETSPQTVSRDFFGDCK